MSTATAAALVGFHEVLLDALVPSSLNPRKVLGDVSDLAASIREVGILEPIVVRPTPMTGQGYAPMYEVVAGSRRLAAAREAGLMFVPVHVKELTDSQAVEHAIVENNQRGDIHPLDEADAFVKLRSFDRAYTPEIIAAKIGRPVAYVRGRLRLLDLVDEVRGAFADDRITIGHADRISRLAPELQGQALRACFSGLFSFGADDDFDDPDDDALDDDAVDDDGDLTAAPAPASSAPRPRAEILQPLHHLDTWIRNHTVLDVKSALVQETLPQLAEQVERLEAEGATLVQLSTAYRPEHGLKGKTAPIPSSAWREVGEKACGQVTQGVVVYGDSKRAQILTVCLKKSKCPKHWPEAPAAAKSAPGGKPDWQVAQEKRDAERKAWEAILPAAKTAVIAHCAGMPVTPHLVALVVGNDHALRSIAEVKTITAKNMGQALALSVALDSTWNEEDFTRCTKRLNFDFKAWRKAHEKALAGPAKTPAAAAKPRAGKTTTKAKATTKTKAGKKR